MSNIMKIMKKHIISLFAAVALMALAACTNAFLEVEAPMQEFIEDYFKTDAHIQEAVVAAYDPLHWTDWNGSQYCPVNIISDIMADQLWVGGQDKSDNTFWHLMMNFEALPNNCLSGMWWVSYSGVKRCNDVLAYVAAARESLTDEAAKYYEEQARVLRVFYYNWLWKFWGNIPYYEENLSGDFLCEQQTADYVYDKMIKDLEGALAIDALPMRETAENYGRVTKAMAYMLYAEVVMYQKDEARYPTALSYMKEIIADSGYELVDDYATIFLNTGEWSSESIFEITYRANGSYRSWGSPLVAGGTVIPRLISPYNFSGAGHENGWGFAPVRQETYDMYQPTDARRDATCWYAPADGSYEKRYQDTGYFLEKYVAKAGGNAGQIADGDLNYDNNLRVYRYSETLLNAAELLLATGGSNADAKTYLNAVHHRAGLADDVDATLDNIIEERRLEFVGEGKRYWDLVRTGKAATTLVPDAYGYRTNTWSEQKKYLPIPQSEIDAAQNTLKQNAY